MPLNVLFILNRMLLFYINFGDCNPPYPALGSNIPSARRPGQRFNFLQCRGCSLSLCFVNRHGGTLRRAGWVERPQVPSPHTRVAMSPSHFYTQPIKSLFFFNHSVVFTSSKVINQHFGVIEFVDQHILEKL